MIDPLLPVLLSAAFGALWLAAAWHKLADPGAFAATLADYRVLPAPLVAAAARALPWLEALLGLWWLLGLLRVPLVVLTSILLGVYAAAMAVNLARGRTDFDCGCGFAGSASRHQLSWRLVGRNLALMLLAVSVLLPTTGRPLGIGDYLVVAAALLAAMLLHAAIGQLQHNRARLAGGRNHV